MNIKKLSAVAISLLMVFSLTSCKGKKDASLSQESTTVVESYVNVTVDENALNSEYVVPENTTTFTSVPESLVQETSQVKPTEDTNTDATEDTQIHTTELTESVDDPVNWSKERIVEEYKKAARKSHATAKSTRNITLKEIKLNNGEYEDAISLVKPLIAKFIESNSTEVEGITGGFENMVPGDVNSANAYKNGSDTVIEMTMVEQVSGAKEDAMSGSVGHAITAVGDISTVIKDLSDMGLPLELSEKDTKIYYTNPVVKVTVNSDGEIVSGTWSYTVEISMNNFKAFGQSVDKASIIMDNVISV